MQGQRQLGSNNYKCGRFFASIDCIVHVVKDRMRIRQKVGLSLGVASSVYWIGFIGVVFPRAFKWDQFSLLGINVSYYYWIQ